METKTRKRRWKWICKFYPSPDIPLEFVLVRVTGVLVILVLLLWIKTSIDLHHQSSWVMSLTRNKQSSELEATCGSLGEELQKRCMCPRCHLDNLEAISELLANEEKWWCLVSSFLHDQTLKAVVWWHCTTELCSYCMVSIWTNLAIAYTIKDLFCIDTENGGYWECIVLIVLSDICFTVDCISYWPIICLKFTVIVNFSVYLSSFHTQKKLAFQKSGKRIMYNFSDNTVWFTSCIILLMHGNDF